MLQPSSKRYLIKVTQYWYDWHVLVQILVEPVDSFLFLVDGVLAVVVEFVLQLFIFISSEKFEDLETSG